MIDKLIELLESFGYEVYQQGSMSDDDVYPETFITFWNRDSPDHTYYDNDNYGTSWEFDVNVYSSDRDLVFSLLDDIRTLLKQNKFICPSSGHDVLSDEGSHTGRGMEVLYLET